MTGPPPLPAKTRPGGPTGSVAVTLRPDNSVFVLQIVDNPLNNTVTMPATWKQQPHDQASAARHRLATRPHHV